MLSRRTFLQLIGAAALAPLAAPLLRPSRARAFGMELCDYCRRNWDDSPSRMQLTVKAHTHEKSIPVCSPFCLAAVLRDHDWYEPESVQVVPWDSRAELGATMLSADSA